MRLQGSYTFEASLPLVWNALTDSEKVSRCLPGNQSFEHVGEDSYRVTLQIGIGSIRGRYQGTVTITDAKVNESYKLAVEGRGAAGAVKGAALVSLRQEGNKTVVDVSADVQVSGTIARMGQRIIGRASNIMMDSFFECMGKTVAPE